MMHRYETPRGTLGWDIVYKHPETPDRPAFSYGDSKSGVDINIRADSMRVTFQPVAIADLTKTELSTKANIVDHLVQFMGDLGLLADPSATYETFIEPLNTSEVSSLSSLYRGTTIQDYPLIDSVTFIPRFNKYQSEIEFHFNCWVGHNIRQEIASRIVDNKALITTYTKMRALDQLKCAGISADNKHSDLLTEMNPTAHELACAVPREEPLIVAQSCPPIPPGASSAFFRSKMSASPYAPPLMVAVSPMKPVDKSKDIPAARGPGMSSSR